MHETRPTTIELLSAISGKPAPNQDPETKAHYGVIHSNALGEWMVDEFYDHGTDESYESAVTDCQDEIRRALQSVMPASSRELFEVLSSVDVIKYHMETAELAEWCDDNADVPVDALETLVDSLWSEISDQWGDSYSMGQCDPSTYSLEQDGYLLQLCSDGDIFVLKSPFVTYTRECSPCAPNAGYLNGSDGGLMTYCLGPEWFDDENPCPVREMYTFPELTRVKLPRKKKQKKVN